MNKSNEDLTKRITSLENEVSGLQQKVYHLEKKLNILTSDKTHFPVNEQDLEKVKVQHREKTSEKAVEQTQIAQTKLVDQQTPIAKSNVKKQSIPTEKDIKLPKKEFQFEDLLGIWLPRIFMGVLIIGVLWALKVGIDNNWISYEVRIVIGYAATALIFYLGIRNMRKNHEIFGITLISGTIAIGLLVTIAAYYLYEFFPYLVAMMISLVYIILGLVMAKRTKSETLTIFTGFAGFLLPFLIVGTTAETWTFCLYILVLFSALFYIAIDGKHRLSYYVTFFFFQITLLIYTLINLTLGDEIFIVATVLIQHLLFLIFYIKQLISRSVFTETTIYLNVIFVIAWIKLLETQEETIAYGMFALLYILLTVLGSTRKDIKLQSIFSAVAIFTISAFILSFHFDQGETKLLLLLINGAVGTWVGLYFKSIRSLIISSFIYCLTALSTIALVHLDAWLSIEHLTWLGFIASAIFIYVSYYTIGMTRFKIKEKAIDMSLVIGQLIGLIYVFQLIDMAIITKIVAMDFSLSTHISLLVILCYIIGSFLAYKWKHGLYIAYAAIVEFIIAGLILLSLPLVDYFSQQTTFIFNLFTEVIFLATLISLFIMIIQRRVAIIAKFHKHTHLYSVILQIVAFIFLNKWYFAFVDIYKWEHDYVYIGHTIWMFLFAFVSISLGSRFNWNIVRYLGVALIGVCLLKLFFIDLISVSIVIRAILFIAVGIIGLVYSRMLLKSSSKNKGNKED